MIEGEKPTTITIRAVKPSEILPEQYESLGLIELMRGYGFTDGLLEQAQHEYGEDEPGKLIYFAFNEYGKAIGSLSVHPVYGTGEVDDLFYRCVEAVSQEAASTLQNLSVSIWNVDGIILDPQARGKGLSKKLLQAFVTTVHPAIVIGRTKTPEAVLTRANTLAQFGFRTWYGTAEVTPHNLRYPETFLDHEVILEAYGRFKGEGMGENAEMFVSPDILSPEIPDLLRLPSYIVEAYQPVLHAQQRENDEALQEKRRSQTAVLPLIAICVGN